MPGGLLRNKRVPRQTPQQSLGRPPQPEEPQQRPDQHQRDDIKRQLEKPIELPTVNRGDEMLLKEMPINDGDQNRKDDRPRQSEDGADNHLLDAIFQSLQPLE